jgi:hypothetical protein
MRVGNGPTGILIYCAQTTGAATRLRCRQTLGPLTCGYLILSHGLSARLAASAAQRSGRILNLRRWGPSGGRLGTKGHIGGLCASGDAFMSEADVARTEAEKCRRLAVRAADRIDKDALQRMADEWLRLAQANERNGSKTISIKDAAD